jgi:uncharacterized membrane protein
MDPFRILLSALLIGGVAGLRSLTAPAAVAWAAHLQWLDLRNTPVALMGSTGAVVIFTLLALLELVADKLPSTPARTAPPGLIGRIVFGGLSGACLAASGMASIAVGAFLGAAGGVAGAFGGYQARTRLGRALKVPDTVIACLEDAAAIGAGLFIVSRL